VEVPLLPDRHTRLPGASTTGQAYAVIYVVIGLYDLQCKMSRDAHHCTLSYEHDIHRRRALHVVAEG